MVNAFKKIVNILLFSLILVHTIVFAVSGVGVVDVSLSCIASSKISYVGDVVYYDFDVSYVGFRDYLYVDLSVEGLPEGWVYYFDYGGSRVYGLNIYNMSRIGVRLVIEVPGDAGVGSYVFYVVASYDYPPYESRLKLELHVELRSPSLRVYSNFPCRVVECGGSVNYDLHVYYSGPGRLFNLLCTGLPSSFTYSFEVGGEAVESMFVEGEFSCILNLAVHVPLNASLGKYFFEVRFSSSDLNYSVPLTLIVKPKPILRSFDAIIDYPSISVDVGDAAYFNLILRNRGSVSETLYFKVLNCPGDWSIEFIANGKPIWGLSIEPGFERRVTIKASPQISVGIGVYNFIIKVASEDGFWSRILNLTVHVIGKPKIRIRLLETPALSLTAVAGEPIKLTVEVSNIGTSNASDIYLDIEVPSIEWRYTIDPDRIELLRPGGKFNFTLTITPSPVIVPGDYMIDITAYSREVSSNTLSLRVTITKPTEWGYYIIVIVIIAAFFLFIFFKIRGRR